MVVDLSVAEQEYVEDCEVCCRPMELRVVVTDSGVEVFAAGEE